MRNLLKLAGWVVGVVATVMLAFPASAQIPIEIVAMDLVGPNPFGAGDIHVGVEEARASTGEVESAAGGASFLDVYAEITIDDCSGEGVATLILDASEDAVRLEADLGSLPPEDGEEYVDFAAVEKLLESDNPACVLQGILLEISHLLGVGAPIIVDLGDGKLKYTYANSTVTLQISINGPGGLVEVDVVGSVTIVRSPPQVPALGTWAALALVLVLTLATAFIWRQRVQTTA